LGLIAGNNVSVGLFLLFKRTLDPSFKLFLQFERTFNFASRILFFLIEPWAVFGPNSSLGSGFSENVLKQAQSKPDTGELV
jgi:hypothetical protein